jgi:hypothetical protein
VRLRPKRRTPKKLLYPYQKRGQNVKNDAAKMSDLTPPPSPNILLVELL